MAGAFQDPRSAVLMEEMSIFADQNQVKAILHEYLRRILLEKPADPISFLINEIKTNPYGERHVKFRIPSLLVV